MPSVRRARRRGELHGIKAFQAQVMRLSRRTDAAFRPLDYDGTSRLSQADAMQMLIQVVCSKGRSLREAIAGDARLDRHQLQVVHQKRPGRSHGWAKLKSTLPDRRGAINLEWDANTSVLISRVVTKGRGRPNLIIGDFIDYLLARHGRRVQAINIIPRD